MSVTCSGKRWLRAGCGRGELPVSPGARSSGSMSPGRLWSGLLAVLAFLCPTVSSCGLSTHVEIGHRALEFLHLHEGHVDYRKLLLEHQDAYQAGTVFPDSFYPSFCKGDKPNQSQGTKKEVSGSR